MKRYCALLAFLAVPAALLAGPITSVVVYGDSLSDNGNLYAAVGQPGAPYYQGRRSNGPVAVEYLAQQLGVSLHDYAWIGATTGIGNYGDNGTTTTVGYANLPGMLTEFNSTSSLVSSYAGALFVVWGGPNDFLSPSPLDTTPQQQISRSVADLLTIVAGLEAKGATNILVPGMPDLGLTPSLLSLGPVASAQASAYTNAFNAALQASLPAGVKYFDSASLMRSIVANPAAYGFTDVTDACFTGTSVCSNPDQYLFWDSFHPTTAADRIIAEEFASTVPEPASFLLVTAGMLALALARRRR